MDLYNRVFLGRAGEGREGSWTGRGMRESTGKLSCLGRLQERWRKKISFSASPEYF